MKRVVGIRAFLRRLRNAQDGVTTIEYALIAGLIFVVIVISVTAAGLAANNTFNKVSVEFNSNH